MALVLWLGCAPTCDIPDCWRSDERTGFVLRFFFNHAQSGWSFPAPFLQRAEYTFWLHRAELNNFNVKLGALHNRHSAMTSQEFPRMFGCENCGAEGHAVVDARRALGHDRPA